ncbi:LCP family protein [Patescibacteria group bacterium]|nr:LCP family protein [Patescibacteria group bacterium]
MQPKFRRIYVPKLRFLLAVFLSAGLIVFGIRTALWIGHIEEHLGIDVISAAEIFAGKRSVLDSTGGRTNILLLGVAGGDHAGPDLTDTMLVLSLREGVHTLSILSVPRDIWSFTLKDKINSAYHYGEEKKQGGGMVLAQAEVEDIIGMPIHYVVVVDFSGFERIINLAGGVTLDVPEAFTDREYPVAGKENDECGGDPAYGCRYMTVHFDKGRQTLNGTRALEYVRSRHAEGNEGSDFARERRQQDVLLALREKLGNPWFWTDIRRDRALYGVAVQTIVTDMTPADMAATGVALRNIPPANIAKIAIDTEFTAPPAWLYGGRYVLVPRQDYDAVHAFIAKHLR